ncbi:MAG: hypothetical protein CMG59_01105 [Candidatus Marinimicrobia bacterium]|nr:hypothetical protein [Candidatus Neomarinimicrobiota bacterium]|tara:strand:+ start:317 stop:643 length:327 start_codon:yes stop_codon:yes gene_type:complete
MLRKSHYKRKSYRKKNKDIFPLSFTIIVLMIIAVLNEFIQRDRLSSLKDIKKSYLQELEESRVELQSLDKEFEILFQQNKILIANAFYSDRKKWSTVTIKRSNWEIKN